MSYMAIRYNKKTSKQLGWSPLWFSNRDIIDKKTIDMVKSFQRHNNLTPDGKVGPTTFRRLYNEVMDREPSSKMLVSGEYVPVPKNLKIKHVFLPSSNYKMAVREEDGKNPKMIVTHWDAARSAESCRTILHGAGISTHFCIDNDGTVFQYVDTDDIAWHAKGNNNLSIGIDFSNAYYLKYQDYYVKNGFGKRPVLRDSVVHGRTLKPHLGYYPEQIKSYKKLVKFLCEWYDIPMQTPVHSKGQPVLGVFRDAADNNYSGVVCHYHLTKNKIDCAGLPLEDILNTID